MSSNQEKSTTLATLALTLGVGGLVLGFAFLYYLPSHRAKTKLRREIEMKTQYLMTAASLPTALQAVGKEVDLTEAYNDRWRTDAGGRKRVRRILGEIHQDAEREGLVTERFDPQPTTVMDAISRTQVTLGVVGPFDHAMEFLRRVEDRNEDIWIKSLDIEKKGSVGREDGSADQEKVEVQAVLEIFTGNTDSFGNEENID